MTVPILAGQFLVAEDLNDLLPLIAVTTVSSVKTSNTTPGAITGLVVALEANTSYIIDGYVPYNTDESIRFQFSAPASSVGTWYMYGSGIIGTNVSIFRAETLSVALDDYVDLDSLGVAINYGSRLVGFVATAGTAGNLQLQFRQGISDPVATTIQPNAWLRAVKVSV